MNNNKDNKIIISKLDLNLTDFNKKKFNVNLNRVAFIFLVIFFFVILYSTRVIYLSSKTLQNETYIINKIDRADIIDRNGAPVDYFSSVTKPDSNKFISAIEKELYS